MEWLNQKNQMATVYERWVNSTAARYHPLIEEKLQALDFEIATPVDVALIIGNNSWIAPRTCNECGASSWDVVQLGEEPDYESRTANICKDCLKAALKLMGE